MGARVTRSNVISRVLYHLITMKVKIFEGPSTRGEEPQAVQASSFEETFRSSKQKKIILEVRNAPRLDIIVLTFLPGIEFGLH